MILATIVGWFVFTSLLAVISGYLEDFRNPFSVYLYNAFTTFSNLNDTLELSMHQVSEGVYTPKWPEMILSYVNIIAGMVGISLLTATVTSSSVSMDEAHFDSILDDLRRLAVLATLERDPSESAATAHRTLQLIIARIDEDIVPYRTNYTLHQVNVYEFDYLFTAVINRILRASRLLERPDAEFITYDLNAVRRIIAWAESLDALHGHLDDPTPSPVSQVLTDAWKYFSVDLVGKIQTSRATPPPTS